MADRTNNNDREVLATQVRDLRAREQELTAQIEEQKKRIAQLEAKKPAARRKTTPTRQQLNRQAQDVADAYAISNLENEQRYQDEVEGNRVLLEELERVKREVEEYRESYETLQKQFDALVKANPNADSVEDARIANENLQELNLWYAEIADGYQQRSEECKELKKRCDSLLESFKELQNKDESLESQIVTLRKRSRDLLSAAKNYKAEALGLAEEVRQIKIREGVNSRDGHLIDALEMAFNENVPKDQRIQHTDDDYTRRKKLYEMIKYSNSKKVRGTSKSYEETLKRAYENVSYLLAPNANDADAVAELSGLYKRYGLTYRQDSAADLLRAVAKERTKAKVSDLTKGKGEKGFAKKLVAIGLAVGAGVAILVAALGLAPKFAVEKQNLQGDLGESQQQTLNEQEAGEFTRFVGQDQNNVGKHYGAMAAVADTTQQVFDNNGITPSSLKSVSVRADGEGVDYTWEGIQAARQEVESFYKIDETGKLDENCAYAQAVNGYRTSIQNGEADFQQDLQSYREGTLDQTSDLSSVMHYTEIAAANSEYVQAAAPALLSELGFATSTGDVIEVGVDEAAVNEYNGVLRDNSLGGMAISVESAKYTKATGDVELLVRCSDRRDREFISLVKYTIAPNQNYVSAKNLLAPLTNKDVKVSRTSFNNDLEVTVDSATVNLDGTEVTGNIDLAYSITTNYNDKSKTTTVTASALVLVGGQYKVFSVEKTYDGVKKASQVEDTMKATLLKEVNRVTGAGLEMVVDNEASI